MNYIHRGPKELTQTDAITAAFKAFIIEMTHIYGPEEAVEIFMTVQGLDAHKNKVFFIYSNEDSTPLEE